MKTVRSRQTNDQVFNRDDMQSFFKEKPYYEQQDG